MKIPINKPSDIAKFYDTIRNKAIRLANLYNGIRADLFKDVPYDRDICIRYVSGSYDELEDIRPDFFECYHEYNSSCHCHPEYCKQKVKLPTSLLTLDIPEDWEPDEEDGYYSLIFDEKILSEAITEIVMKEKNEAFAAIESKKNAQKIEKLKKEEERRIAKEKKDESEFERLKKKYGK